MKKEWLVVACLFLFLPSVLSAAGEEKKDVKFFAKEPVLLTSAGQSADVQMVKVLLERTRSPSRRARRPIPATCRA